MNMSSILLAFFSSLIATILIIRFNHLHGNLTGDLDLSGPQKFHKKTTPRIGGVSIAIGLFLAICIIPKKIPDVSLVITLFLCAIPTFLIGLSEDLTKKIGVLTRLIFIIFSASLVSYLLEIKITNLNISEVDFLLTLPLVAPIFTVFAITGLVNAYNIIDGFHGLSSMVGIVALVSIAYLGFIMGDQTIVFLSLIMVAAILGFFFLNYPNGLIFLGDSGAYIIGFWIASLSILLTHRYKEVSPWFAFLINGYPIIETIFTIYRRKIHQNKSPGMPDGKHLHTLIYRRILAKNGVDDRLFSANSRTAPYMWILTTLGVVPAILWWQSTTILILASIVFFFCYIWLYSSIVKFKTPKWLRVIK